MIKENQKDKIISSIKELVFITDNDFIVNWQNKAAEKFFSQDMRGLNFTSFFNISAAHISKIPARIESTVTTSKNKDLKFSHKIIKAAGRGEKAGYIIISEETAVKNDNESILRSMIEFENLLTKIAFESGSIPVEEIDTQLSKILMLIGEFADIDRCYLAILTPPSNDIVVQYDWSAPGFKPTRNNVKFKHIPFNWSRKKRTEIIMIPDVRKIKYPAGSNHEIVFSRGIISVMLVPLYLSDKLFGYLGFSSSKKIINLPKDLASALKITAEIIVTLFDRKKSITQIELNKKIAAKSSGMMAYTDSEGYVIMSNESFQKFHGEELMNLKEHQLPGLYLDHITSGKENFTSSFEKCRSGIETKTEIWINKNNSLRLFEIIFHPVISTDNTVSGIIFNSNDITERVQLEARILEVIHTERKKIGITLHDDLGHDLLAVAIKSRLIHDRLKAVSPELSREVHEIEIAIKSAIDEVRRLSRGLIPYKNSGLDFREMIDALTLTIERDYKLKCDFSIDKKISIDDESIIKEIFYIIDEAVLNSIKHSQCSRISIAMYRENNMIKLSISDNGKGIADKAGKEPGVGLEIMKYRARALGGGLEIINKPGKGTSIECIFSPVKIQP